MLAGEEGKESQNGGEKAVCSRGCGSGSGSMEEFAHEQAEIESGDVYEEPFGDVLVTFEEEFSHAAQIEIVGESPFEKLTSAL